ncbi:MAG: hypothetical protein ABSC17_08545, partial [Thermacetogeniaceae bacterium]
SFDGTVTYSIPSLASGAFATAIYAVQVIEEIPAFIYNSAAGIFNILPTDPTPYLAVPSNTTVIIVEGTDP